MKKIAFLSLFLMLATFSFAQQKQAKITFENIAIDFGDIKEGEIKKHTFKFKNTGNDILVLFDIRTTCGCTATEWTRQPIPPGESGEVTITFNSKGKSGIQNKVITIISNAQVQQKTLKIRTNVLQNKQ